MEKPLLTRRETADLLGVSEKTLFNWEKAGSIKSTRLGRLVRFTREEINRIAKEGIL